MSADADADSCNNTVIYEYTYDLAAHRCGQVFFAFFQKAPTLQNKNPHMLFKKGITRNKHYGTTNRDYHTLYNHVRLFFRNGNGIFNVQQNKN